MEARFIVGGLLAGFFVGQACKIAGRWQRSRRFKVRELFILTTIVALWAAAVAWQYGR